MVLFVREAHVSKSLRKVIASGRFRATLDTAFADVMAGCAEPRRDADGTWITDEMTDAYVRLAEIGLAHSVEVWEGDDLVGGLYGVAIGRMFYGESMFSRASNASKVALTLLAAQLDRWQFELIDCQMTTTHLASMGAREIPRAEFLRYVQRLTREKGTPAPWRFDREIG
jgi:leucyl/phenylalanyl-tRNA--protein transferase